MNDIEEMIGQIGRTEGARKAAYAKMLIQRLQPIVNAYKSVYGDDLDHEGEEVRIDGQTVATVTRTKDGAGRWVVADPEAYGRFLREYEIGIPDKALPEAWEMKPMPREQACTQEYLSKMAKDHDGVPPVGVEYKKGRSGSVHIDLERNFKSMPLTAQTVSESLKLIEGTIDEH